MRIVTHGGRAHADDFIATCLVLAAYPAGIFAAVFRRDPTPEELASVHSVVLDIGGQCDPDAMNYDHHQMAAGGGICSITLVMEHVLCWCLDTARDVFPWLAFKESVDTTGPDKTGEKYSISRESMLACLSPIETQMVRAFGDMSEITPDHWLWHAMRTIGSGLISYYNDIAERIALLDKHTVLRLVGQDTVVADFTAAGVLKNTTMGVETYLEQVQPGTHVTVTFDERTSAHLSLFRRHNAAEKVDFRKIVGQPGVHFVHNTGFVAKVDATLPQQTINNYIAMASTPAV